MLMINEIKNEGMHFSSSGNAMPELTPPAAVPKKNSSCKEPHTAVGACCADGSAAEQTPTTREELGNENK
jgi:hypothetical protein